MIERLRSPPRLEEDADMVDRACTARAKRRMFATKKAVTPRISFMRSKREANQL